MAMPYASTSVMFTSPSPKPYCASLRKTPFIGFPVEASSKPSIRTTSFISTNRTFQIRCEDRAVVPLDQRWMYEESEIKGLDIWNKTWYPKAADHVNADKPWFVVDATDKILGRLASTIAIHIRGKNLATYTPSVDMGAFVIVLGRALFNHLKVHSGPNHPHEAQKPMELPIMDKRIQKQR